MATVLAAALGLASVVAGCGADQAHRASTNTSAAAPGAESPAGPTPPATPVPAPPPSPG